MHRSISAHHWKGNSENYQLVLKLDNLDNLGLQALKKPTGHNFRLDDRN